MFFIALNKSYFPLKISVNINGKWETRICLVPRDIPQGHSFQVIETNVKVEK